MLAVPGTRIPDIIRVHGLLHVIATAVVIFFTKYGTYVPLALATQMSHIRCDTKYYLVIFNAQNDYEYLLNQSNLRVGAGILNVYRIKVDIPTPF